MEDDVFLQQELETLRLENKRLNKDNAALRGLNKKLTSDLQHYVALCDEGDTLYEQSIHKKEMLEKEIDNLKECLHIANFAIKQKDKEIEELEQELYSRPENDKKVAEKSWCSKLFSFFKR